MAHSNRQKIKEGRGGLTRNQARKSKQQTSSQASNRLQETIKWLADIEEKKKVKTVATKGETKVVKFSKTSGDRRRREKALLRLENQLKTGIKQYKDGKDLDLPDELLVVENNEIKHVILSDSQKARIKKEIQVLKSRI